MKFNITWKKVGIAAAAVAVLAAVGILTEHMYRYSKAEKLLKNGDVVGAYETWDSLRGFRNANARKEEIVNDYAKEVTKRADIGDTIFFGHYEQSGIFNTGGSPVEWMVLDKQDEKVLLMTKDVIEVRSYHSIYEDVTWETCDLRRWLNSKFYDACFSPQEKTMVQLSHLEAGTNPDFNTIAGETDDYVFFLSIAEMGKYFPTPESRLAVPNEYAKIMRHAHLAFENPHTWYWLRSPGFIQFYAAVVNDDGEICTGAYSTYHTQGGVRPCIWLDLSGN